MRGAHLVGRQRSGARRGAGRSGSEVAQSSRHAPRAVTAQPTRSNINGLRLGRRRQFLSRSNDWGTKATAHGVCLLLCATMTAKYVIGIDLGTTNSVVAYAPL